MTDHSTPRLRMVKIRLSGHPDDVDQVVRAISDQFVSGAPSARYANRCDPATVRVYLEVTPA